MSGPLKRLRSDDCLPTPSRWNLTTPIRDLLRSGPNSETDEQRTSPSVISPDKLLSKSNLALFTNWASSTYGAQVIFATNQLKSACSASNVLSDSGYWLTRRRRTPGHEWLIVKLAIPVYIRGIIISTLGCVSPAPHINIVAARDFGDGCAALVKNLSDPFSDDEELRYPLCDSFEQSIEQKITNAYNWNTIVPLTRLEENSETTCVVELPSDTKDYKFDLIRVNLHPDGGLSQIRIAGETREGCKTIWKYLENASEDSLINYANILRGAWIVHSSSAGAFKMLEPHPYDREGAECWITPRNRNRGPVISASDTMPTMFDHGVKEYAIIKLGARAEVSKVTLSTWACAEDLPVSVRIMALDRKDLFDLPLMEQRTRLITELLDSQVICLGTIDREEISNNEEYNIQFTATVMTHVLVCLFPDGAINGIKVFGQLYEEP